MSKYSTTHQFSQESPYHVCQRQAYFDRLSEERGYPCKCRVARCSLACFHNMMDQEARILQFLWSILPDDFKTYRGNLTMPKDADESQHDTARSKFRRSMTDFARRVGATVRFRAYEEITDPRNKHYDFVAYADGSVTLDQLRSQIARAWVKAGGLRSTCRRLESSAEEQAWARYVVKARKADRYRNVPRHGGQDVMWGSQGFYYGTTRDGMWKRYIKAMFPTMKEARVKPVETSPDRARRPIIKSVNLTPNLTPNPTKNPTREPMSEQPFNAALGPFLGVLRSMMMQPEGSVIRYQEGGPMDEWLNVLADVYPERIEIETLTSGGPKPDPVAALVRLLPRAEGANVPIRTIAGRLGWSVGKVQETMTRVPGLRWVKRYDAEGCGYYLS